MISLGLVDEVDVVADSHGVFQLRLDCCEGLEYKGVFYGFGVVKAQGNDDALVGSYELLKKTKIP